MRYFILFSSLFVIPIFADPVNAATDPTIYENVVISFKASANQWAPIFTKLGYYLFGSLAAIQIAWELGLMAAEGKIELGGVFVTLMRTLVLFGIFYGLIGSIDIFIGWFTSFSGLADQANTAASGGAKVLAADLVASAAQLFHLGIDTFSVFDIGKSLALIIASFLAAILLVLLSIQLLMSILKFYFYVYMNIFMMGFAALNATRQYAINGVTNLLRAGLEVLMIKLVIGLSITSIMNFSKDAVKASNGDNQSLIYLLILSLAMFSLAKMIPGMVESYFSGMGAQNSNFGSRIAQAGISSATSSIKTGVNSATATKSQTQALHQSKTASSSTSQGAANSSGGNGMNNPIMGTSSSNSTAIDSTLRAGAKTIAGVAGATIAAGVAMGKEAFEMNSGSDKEPKVKKFPTEYRPSEVQENGATS